jgi:hypothetical protein
LRAAAKPEGVEAAARTLPEAGQFFPTCAIVAISTSASGFTNH